MESNAIDLAYLLLTAGVECITLGVLILAAARETSLTGRLYAVFFLIAVVLMLMARALSLVMNLLVGYLEFRDDFMISKMNGYHILIFYAAAFTAIAGCILYFTSKQISISAQVPDGNPYTDAS